MEPKSTPLNSNIKTKQSRVAYKAFLCISLINKYLEDISFHEKMGDEITFMQAVVLKKKKEGIVCCLQARV